MSYGTATLDHSSPTALIQTCDGYLASREGRYPWRCVRYDRALEAMEMLVPLGRLTRELTVCDVGAGWTEFGRRMYERGWEARYWPVDGCLDGVDLDHWSPPRGADLFVALELLEHLEDPWRLVRGMKEAATLGIVVSTPNPRTTDVLGMDATHHTPIHAEVLHAHGFDVHEVSFYGKPADTLFATWSPA